MTEPHDDRTLGRFATVLSSLSGEESLTARLSEAGRLMLDADGSALTLNYTGEDRLTVSATNQLARTLEDLQDVVGEGPGHDAARTGSVVIAQLGNGDEQRWIALADRLKAIGFTGTVLAIPLSAEHSQLGVMTLHRAQPQKEDDESLARFLGVTVSTALLQDPKIGSHELTATWEYRAEIHQATGMVVAQLGVRPEDAMALLRGQAFARARPLAEVANDIIQRRINFRDFTIEGD